MMKKLLKVLDKKVWRLKWWGENPKYDILDIKDPLDRCLRYLIAFCAGGFSFCLSFAILLIICFPE